MTTARMRVITMVGMQPGAWCDVPVGVPIADLQPEHEDRQILILRVNGAAIPREHWGEPVEADYAIEWLLDPPADREQFRTTLQIAAIAAAIIPGAQFAAPYLAAASFAYNALLPPRQPDQGSPAASIFNASVNGNAALLDDPVWKIYGIDKITPPFAGMPYTEYLDDDGDDTDNQQYFFGVYAIGCGPYDVLASYLGKTPINHYKDVLRAIYLPPGTQPLVAKAGVWTSQDIGNFELDPAKSPGSYPACPPKRTVGFVGVDVTADQGLGRVDSDGDSHAITVQWQVQVRNIDDAGAPIGRFRTLQTETRTLNTNTPQRWSGKYLVSPAARVEVRVIRVNPKFDDKSTTRDAIQWSGMRGYSDVPAPLNPNVAHFEVVLRASQNMSQVNQTQLSLLVQGMVRTWNPDTGWSCDLGDYDNYAVDAARSPAWAIADALTDNVYGEGLADERIDLAGLYELDQVWRARQDRCDYTFSSTTDIWSAVQLLARTGRARMFRRYSVRAFKRDELETAPVTMFSPRMCIAGTKMQIDETHADSQTGYDGIIAQFRDNSKWDANFVECPCPGVTTITRPVYRQYPGVQGRTHALREGLYDAADMALRRRTVSLQTEMQAELAAFLEPVLWQPQLASMGQSGDCVSYDTGTRSLETTEPISFDVTPVQIWLRRDDGSVTDPIGITPGSDEWHVVLAVAPDFELVCNDGTRERPQFMAGAAELVKIASIDDGGRAENGAPFWKVTAIPDDDRVHAADNAYLPGPGDLQDPISLPDDTPSGGGTGDEVIYIPAVAWEDGAPVTGGGNGVGVDLFNDGHAAYYASQLGLTTVPSAWVASNPIDPTVAALYEAFVSISTAAPADYVPFLTGDAVDTWVNLGTSRSWHVDAGTALDRNPVYFRIQIRAVGDTAAQADTTWVGTINATNQL